MAVSSGLQMGTARRFPSHSAAVLVLAGLGAAWAWAGSAPLFGVVDLSGRARDPLPAGKAGPTVLVFTRTDCPISNRYAPELRRLRERFARRGAAFWLVYPDGSEATDAVRRHQREFGYGFPALRDPEHALVALTGATVTPEVAVFVAGDGGPRMVYRGRIDDRAVDFGRTRSAPTSRDLEQVLDTLASGATVQPRTTPAVGCFIAR